MRRPISPALVLGLIVGLHADWHLARPREGRLSLDWHQHWLFCVAFFAIAAWYIRRRWRDRVWSATAWNLGLALVGAQIVEPILESVGYVHQMGYDVEPARWVAFGVCVLGGGISYIAVLQLLRGFPGSR